MVHATYKDCFLASPRDKGKLYYPPRRHAFSVLLNDVVVLLHYHRTALEQGDCLVTLPFSKFGTLYSHLHG